jgi:hypothetical protein
MDERKKSKARENWGFHWNVGNNMPNNVTSLPEDFNLIITAWYSNSGGCFQIEICRCKKLFFNFLLNTYACMYYRSVDSVASFLALSGSLSLYFRGFVLSRRPNSSRKRVTSPSPCLSCPFSWITRTWTCHLRKKPKVTFCFRCSFHLSYELDGSCLWLTSLLGVASSLFYTYTTNWAM